MPPCDDPDLCFSPTSPGSPATRRDGDSDDDLALPPLISPLELLLQSDEEPFDLRQALMHDGIKDEYDSDTDEEQGSSPPSGPSVLRAFPWPPAPTQTPSDHSLEHHARSPDRWEHSGGVASRVEFFQQTRTDAHAPKFSPDLPASTGRLASKGPAPLSGRYSKKSAPRTARDMPYANSSHVFPNVCASLPPLPEKTAVNIGPSPSSPPPSTSVEAPPAPKVLPDRPAPAPPSCRTRALQHLRPHPCAT